MIHTKVIGLVVMSHSFMPWVNIDFCLAKEEDRQKVEAQMFAIPSSLSGVRGKRSLQTADVFKGP